MSDKINSKPSRSFLVQDGFLTLLL